MADRLLKPMAGCLEAGVVSLFGVFSIGASGAITSSSCKGFSVIKTAAKTGRYTITLQDKYVGLLDHRFSLEGPADAAYGTGGSVVFSRGVDVVGAGGVPLLFLQIASSAAAPVDTDAPSGTKVYIYLVLKNSTAY